jgi:hypothetical protein
MRITIPDRHTAIIVPVELAQDIESYCRLERQRMMRAKNPPITYGVLSDLQLAVGDAINLIPFSRDSE